MNPPYNRTPARVVLIVHDDAAFAEALALDFERRGTVPLHANRSGEARLIISGAPHLAAVLIRCSFEAGGGSSLLKWIAERRPDLAIVAMCSASDHRHDYLPPHAQLLRTPFGSKDLQRALADARTAAFEHDSARARPGNQAEV